MGGPSLAGAAAVRILNAGLPVRRSLMGGRPISDCAAPSRPPKEWQRVILPAHSTSITRSTPRSEWLLAARSDRQHSIRACTLRSDRLLSTSIPQQPDQPVCPDCRRACAAAPACTRAHARTGTPAANCCCFIDPNLGFPTWVAQPTPRAARARAPAAPARARHGKRVRRRHRRGAEPPHQGGHSGGASCGVGPLRPHPPVLAAAPIARAAPRSTMQPSWWASAAAAMGALDPAPVLQQQQQQLPAGRARMGRQCAWAEPMLGIRHPKLANRDTADDLALHLRPNSQPGEPMLHRSSLWATAAWARRA
jgi:hypothetical protein